MPQDQEFWTSVGIIGAIGTLGIFICIGLGMIAIGLFKKIRKNEIAKELYEDKERKNGRAGSHGKW